jgi:hypothetical protein
MKIFNSATYGVLAATALVWFPSSTGAEIDLEAEIKKHLNDPIACGCSKQDETDLESRIKQVEAAIKEYESLIKEWETKERSGKEQLLLTNDNRGSVQGSVGFRMSTVRTPNARSFAAETDPSCKTWVDPKATRCLMGALQDHESVHKKACDANKSMNPFVDWRSKQRLVDYMREEQAGYKKELDRLKSESETMKKYCSLHKSVRYALEDRVSAQERQRVAYDRVDGLRKVLR